MPGSPWADGNAIGVSPIAMPAAGKEMGRFIVRLRVLVRPLLAVGVVSAVGGFAAPAYAQTHEVTTTYVDTIAPCEPGNEWVFQLYGVGEAIGITPPATITASMADGTTVDFPLDHVTGDTDTSEADSAFYALATSVQPTGEATAEIDEAWDPFENSFGLVAGPCAETELTAAVDLTSVVVGGTIRVTGALTLVDGSPLAEHAIAFSVTPPNPPTKGGTQFLGEVETDADGTFSAEFALREPGPLTFNTSYAGSDQLGGDPREHRASVSTVVWSMPSELPPSAGTLTSDAGTTVPAGSQITVSASRCGCGPHLDLAVMIYSTPTLLAITSTDESGSFSSTVTIPEDLVGEHTLVAMVLTEDEELQFLTLPITVTSASDGARPAGEGGGLPVTGRSTLVAAGAGLALVLLGLGAWAVARRRVIRFTTD